MLVGDGPERPHLEDLATALGVRDAVVFTGTVRHDELPEYLGAMDATIVTARAGQAFHYSPLKLREYLASGCPVVAPRIGEVSRTVTDGVDALLYEPGDADGLAERILRLHASPDLATRLGSEGRELVVTTGTWLIQLQRLLDSDAFGRARSRLAKESELPSA